MKLLIGLLLAALFGGAAWWCSHRAYEVTGTPIRSSAAIIDTAPGAQVLAYGGVWTGDGDGLRIFISELRECQTRTTIKDGKTERKTDCDWIEAGRTTPAFDVIVNGQAVRITNYDYQITGPNRTVSTGYATRLRGFANGDGVLILGMAAPGGITAREVYGGTRDQYVFTLHLWMYVWMALAGLCVLGGLVAEWAEHQ